MFDISFVELLTVGAVALIVLGPERLPAAARTVGSLIRRARSSWQLVRDEFERELTASHVRRDVHDWRAEINSLSDRIEAASTYARPEARERRAPHD